jgi:hypothetical protein
MYSYVCMYKGGPKTGPSTATFNDDDDDNNNNNNNTYSML